MSFADLAERIEENTRNSGGGVKPLLVRDVVSVGLGHAFRTGASTDQGEEALVGAAIMLAGETSRLVARAVDAKLNEIQTTLPPGVKIRTLYDRSELVNRTIGTVERNLAEGHALAEKVPGQAYLISQPIQMRFNEIMAGARADLVCKIYGENFDELEQLAGQIRTVLQALPGGEESEFDAIDRVPMLEIKPNRDALQRYNIHAEDVNRVVETALAGGHVGTMIEGNRRFPIVVRLAEPLRADVEVMKRLPVRKDDGE